MTSPDHERTHADHRAGRGPRLPRFSWGTLRGWKVGTPLVFALSGALFLISAQSSQGNDLRPGRVTTMASLVRNESNNVEQLQAEARALTEEVDRLSAAVDDETVQKARTEARNQRPAAGLTEVSGTGLQVVLSDSPREVRSTSDRDEDLLVVHQGDIQAVVNAMWDAGATAITIQGQRIISTTGIKCAGNSVELHGIPYPQPYVIRAVGDPLAMSDRIDADPYIGGFRRDALDPEIQLGWSMTQQADVVAPAYAGIQGMQYAEVADAEDTGD